MKPIGQPFGKLSQFTVSPGLTPEEPILVTIGLTIGGKRVTVVRGMSLTEANSLQCQLQWSQIDWLEANKEGGNAH